MNNELNKEIELEPYKARIAQINARGDDFTTFMVETIN